MSTIGGATAGGLNLIGSIVGSSRPEAVSEKVASANQKMPSDFDAVLGKSLDDVADAQFSADRDADGRQLYQRRATSPETSDETPIDEVTQSRAAIDRSHAADAFGDRGNELDVDA